MRYIKPPDFKSVKEFERAYRKIEEDITQLLTTDGSARSSRELNKKLSQALNLAMLYLSQVNKEYSRKELPKAFKEGRDSIKEPSQLSEEQAAEILAAQGFKYAKNAFTRDTYIELKTATQSAGKGLKSRVNSIIEELRKTGDDSVYNVQQAIAKDLQEHKIFEVHYSNGAKMPLSAYAAMAARSARIESINIGSIGGALQAGTDLVKMTRMPQCCKLCGAYQGKVYSISGKDKRFPALFKTVLKNGYALAHPNCRHEFIPWFEDMEAPEDVEKAIRDSKIKYDSKGNLVDVRFQKDIELYQAWQAGNRQLNREYLEYEQMRKYYAGREEDMPYKSLGTFRRARRADNLSPAFNAWRYRKCDEKQYESWKNALGGENMPKDVDNFQKLKYNKGNSESDKRIQRQMATMAEIVTKKGDNPEYAKKLMDTYFLFRERNVEMSYHSLNRYLGQKTGKNKTFFSLNDIVRLKSKPINYRQEDGRNIRFYDKLCIVENQETGEIISVVARPKTREDWIQV